MYYYRIHSKAAYSEDIEDMTVNNILNNNTIRYSHLDCFLERAGPCTAKEHEYMKGTYL